MTQTSLTLQKIIPLLENVTQRGDKYTASCPVVANHQHGDKKRSLSISESGNKLLLHCFTGCTFEEIVAALAARNGQPNRNVSKVKNTKSNQFNYTQGEVTKLAEALIDEWKNGGEVADFLSKRGITRDAGLALCLGATYRSFPSGGSPALAIPLYHGQELLGMKYRSIMKKEFISETGSNMAGLYGRPDAAAKEILLLEGPLDVALAMSHAFNAVGIQAADISPRKEDLEQLGSYPTLFLVGDSDRAGREAMNKWQMALNAERPEPLIRVGLGYKDIGELYEADPPNFKTALTAILRQARASRVYFQPDDLLVETELRGIDIRQPYAVELLVPRSQISMLFGEEKNGKTLLVTYIGKCVANGLRSLGNILPCECPCSIWI
jgi:hypothetical protein